MRVTEAGTRPARAASSAYVYRRSPWTTASRPGKTAALRTRNWTGESSERKTLTTESILAASPASGGEPEQLGRPEDERGGRREPTDRPGARRPGGRGGGGGG